MSRLVNADELIALFNRRSTINVVGDGLCKVIITRIEALPTVEAVPVVHGAWRSTEGLYTNGICYCSVCETEYYFSDLYDVGEEAQSRLPNFCPHCGAMMNWEEVATDNARMDAKRKEHETG